MKQTNFGRERKKTETTGCVWEDNPRHPTSLQIADKFSRIWMTNGYFATLGTKKGASS